MNLLHICQFVLVSSGEYGSDQYNRRTLIIIFLATVAYLSPPPKIRSLFPSTNELIIFHLNMVSADSDDDDDDDKTFATIRNNCE